MADEEGVVIPLRVVRLPIGGVAGRGILCRCGHHVTALPARCAYCKSEIVPDMVDLAAWIAAQPQLDAEVQSL